MNQLEIDLKRGRRAKEKANEFDFETRERVRRGSDEFENNGGLRRTENGEGS